MKKIDELFFKSLELEQFVPRAIILSLFGDGSYLIFLKFVVGSKEHLKSWMKQYAFLPNMDVISSDPASIQTMWTSFQFFINLAIGLVLLTNVIGYIFFSNGRNFGIGYMKNLAFTGFVFSFFTLWEVSSYGLFWKIIMILLFPLYFYIYRGVKHYYYNNN